MRPGTWTPRRSARTACSGSARPTSSGATPSTCSSTRCARPPWCASTGSRESRGAGSDVEAEGPQLLAALVGDLVRAPRRHPDPVDLGLLDQPGQRRGGLVLDHVGQRAGRGGQGHVQGARVVVVDVDAVDEPEVHHVDAELGVDHVAHGFLDVIDLRDAPGGARVGLGHGLAHAVSSIVCTSSAATACAVASFQAIQPSSAHLIRAGYFDTPSNATASSSTSSCSASTASVSPFVRIRVRNASYALVASARSLPTTRSVITETDACEIEQPSAS